MFLNQYKSDKNAPDPTLKTTLVKIAGQTALLFEKEKYYEKASVYYLQASNPKKAAECLDKAR
ncbi:MAG: hypothetical protein R3A45_00145 [Bdellovibrionota bacterium]